MFRLMIRNYCGDHDHVEYSPTPHVDRSSAYLALMEAVEVITDHDPCASIYFDESEDIIVGFEFFAADTDGGYVAIVSEELVPH